MSAMTPRTLIVFPALPYANGATHLGHLVEHIQVDIWQRAMRLKGHRVIFLCADDTHGTPIMLRAEKDGITPEALIEAVGRQRVADFAAFGVKFDHYSSTHRPATREVAYALYRRHQERGSIETRTIAQLFDPERQMFLPDRYVRGTCPKCGSKDQYGDGCEVCGSTYSPTELIEPYSSVSGAKPELRESLHYFLKLNEFESFLREWTQSGRLQPEVVNKLEEWFKDGLRPWDISRDAPYFGIEIPDAPGKYFYVWWDAPIGYLGTLKEYCAQNVLDFDALMDPSDPAELVHFIGKDIVYFHTLFWPAVLHGAGLKTPSQVNAHGMLTVQGEKMSKSRGTFVTAQTYLTHLNPEHYRYYLAYKLNATLADIDWNLDDFVNRVNADVIGKVVNIASRCAGFIEKRFAGKLAETLPDPEMLERFAAARSEIEQAYESRDSARATRLIMALADHANQYIDQVKPWVIAKDSARDGELQRVCTQGLNLFRALMIYLKPVLPSLADASEAFLRAPVSRFSDVEGALVGHSIEPFQPLLQRVDPKAVAAMIEASKESLPIEPNIGSSPATPKSAAVDALITIDQFNSIDLRIARIAHAEAVPGADKLVRLELDLGHETRQVFAGIKSAYQPETLIGRLTVMVANLAPRKMRFGESQGMVLAASSSDSGLYLLSPDAGAAPGMRVK
jgi:methionyl-tRNA synthetase